MRTFILRDTDSGDYIGEGVEWSSGTVDVEADPTMPGPPSRYENIQTLAGTFRCKVVWDTGGLFVLEPAGGGDVVDSHVCTLYTDTSGQLVCKECGETFLPPPPAVTETIVHVWTPVPTWTT